MSDVDDFKFVHCSWGQPRLGAFLIWAGRPLCKDILPAREM